VIHLIVETARRALTPEVVRIAALTSRLLAAFVFFGWFYLPVSSVLAEERPVESPEELEKAVKSAQPGDRIVLLAGRYRLKKIGVGKAGTQDAPIILTAQDPMNTKIETHGVELFKVSAPYWIFEGLDISGGSASDHAFHVVGGADHVQIRGNRVRNFNAAIKGNPEKGGVPDHVVIEDNLFYNETPRKTAKPVTPIDVVGGEGWTIRGNFIADFAKTGGSKITYGAFLKGGGQKGVFERNLVICEWQHRGGRRVGLSFGGGGYFGCKDKGCPAEHRSGVMRDNIVMNCPNAEGIYINNAADISLYHNTLYRAYGILLRFPNTSAVLQNNIISGAVVERDGALAVMEHNKETGLAIGNYIPGGAEKLTYRISDYHKKFPSVFDRSDIVYLQDLITGVADWLGTTWIGRGDAWFERQFAVPAAGNWALLDGAEILGAGVGLDKPGRDFCGNVRSAGRVDLGAIAYSGNGCDLEAWVSQLLGRFE
jgi:hypothetical protein